MTSHICILLSVDAIFQRTYRFHSVLLPIAVNLNLSLLGGRTIARTQLPKQFKARKRQIIGCQFGGCVVGGFKGKPKRTPSWIPPNTDPTSKAQGFFLTNPRFAPSLIQQQSQGGGDGGTHGLPGQRVCTTREPSKGTRSSSREVRISWYPLFFSSYSSSVVYCSRGTPPKKGKRGPREAASVQLVCSCWCVYAGPSGPSIALKPPWHAKGSEEQWFSMSLRD